MRPTSVITSGNSTGTHTLAVIQQVCQGEKVCRCLYFSLKLFFLHIATSVIAKLWMCLRWDCLKMNHISPFVQFCPDLLAGSPCLLVGPFETDTLFAFNPYCNPCWSWYMLFFLSLLIRWKRLNDHMHTYSLAAKHSCMQKSLLGILAECCLWYSQC